MTSYYFCGLIKAKSIPKKGGGAYSLTNLEQGTKVTQKASLCIAIKYKDSDQMKKDVTGVPCV